MDLYLGVRFSYVNVGNSHLQTRNVHTMYQNRANRGANMLKHSTNYAAPNTFFHQSGSRKSPLSSNPPSRSTNNNLQMGANNVNEQNFEFLNISADSDGGGGGPSNAKHPRMMTSEGPSIDGLSCDPN